MRQTNKLKPGSGALLVFILTAGVFGIINTEMGVIGILPLIAEHFHVTVPEAGWTVSIFALVVAISAPIMPLLFSGINRKKVMLLALGVFTLSNIISMLTSNFTILLIARALPAFLHPVYVSMAFTVAAGSVSKEKAPKAVAKVFIGVSAGMVLGVPVTSYIASEVSFTMGMMFFTVVNALVFMATLLFVPSMPVKEKLSYGTQLNVLKKKIIWYSIMAVTLINGALFGFFSYMSDYLRTVTEVSYSVISILLLIYGLANIIGNVIAGKQLATNPIRSMIFIPFALFTFYICIFILGEWLAAMAVLILILGILAGYGQNTMQYMITEAAPEAPDFANGLFLLSANLGTTVGAAACGAFITFFDTRYSVIGSLLFLAVSIIFVVLRIRTVQSSKTMGLKAAA
ncbi:MFS transporter [Bacteroides cellulosilyticus]|uniref:MFS transporter n=1 Tax=Bacteroides cellulosilyticus TaxID=246787 RepID=UPI001C377B00|nr:MFS transporter [Bacteroides cellulosilyticus]MBV3638445.1 MFS transporter [Bacteroides cellulosilyticus]MBV3664710.1 MFS transporter [Bacteroides cellulosilyticus]MBV3686696.1 MFS transporter [Bacteroides cellulosilyticus]MBV3695488.1 MFS transporter [Bacteroides cellulosilyticus]MBV3709057.1 MFS transporter [Bacteroides cellulosilyticus]